MCLHAHRHAHMHICTNAHKRKHTNGLATHKTYTLSPTLTLTFTPSSTHAKTAELEKRALEVRSLACTLVQLLIKPADSTQKTAQHTRDSRQHSSTHLSICQLLVAATTTCHHSFPLSLHTHRTSSETHATYLSTSCPDHCV